MVLEVFKGNNLSGFLGRFFVRKNFCFCFAFHSLIRNFAA